MWIAFAAHPVITNCHRKVSEALRRREQEACRCGIKPLERTAGFIVTLAAGAAHELGTPLGTIAWFSKDLDSMRSASGKCRGAVEARLIRSEVDRCRGFCSNERTRSGADWGDSGAARIGRGPGQREAGLRAPEETWSKRKLPGKAGRWLFLPTPPGRRSPAGGETRWTPAEHHRIAHRGCPRKAAFTVQDSGCGNAARDARRVRAILHTKPPAAEWPRHVPGSRLRGGPQCSWSSSPKWERAPR